MIDRIDHTSIAVNNFKEASDFFTRILGAIPGSFAEDKNMEYIWQLFYLGDLSRIELLGPTGKNSFLNNFLSDKTGGVHHITLQTPDIRKAAEILDKNNIPYFDFHEYGAVWKELFIHPKNAFGVLIQIAEFTADDWLPEEVRMKKSKKFAVSKNGNTYTLTINHAGGGTKSVDLSKEELMQLRDDLNKF